jgi:hypothetical protein
MDLLPPSFLRLASLSFLPLCCLTHETAAYGTSYDVILEIGGNSYPVVADTASADLWLFEPG